MFKKAFGRNLKRLRKERKITQEHLSELIGIHPRQVSKIETGEHFPNSKTLENICTALNVEPRELFNFNRENSDKTGTADKLMEKIRILSKDKYGYTFLKLAVGALQNNEDLEKLEMLISGMKLAGK